MLGVVDDLGDGPLLVLTTSPEETIAVDAGKPAKVPRTK
jgi:hypothetical protein